MTKLVYRLMYVVIALSYIRRIFMRSGILTPDSYVGACCWGAPDEVVIESETLNDKNVFVVQVGYGGKYTWFDDGGHWVNVYDKTPVGYADRKSGKLLTPDMNLVPSGYSPAYSRICRDIMRYIRKTAC